VQQHLGRLDGVAKVDVSLADGEVTVYAKEDSRLDPARIFKGTYDSGVSITEMTLDATGYLEKDPNRGLVFRASGTQILEVAPNDVSRPFAYSPESVRVFVRARLYKKAGKQKAKTLGPIRLELIEVRKEP